MLLTLCNIVAMYYIVGRLLTKTRIIYQAKEYKVPIARYTLCTYLFFNFKVAFKELDKHLDL